jgi:hypothetical protein
MPGTFAWLLSPAVTTSKYTKVLPDPPQQPHHHVVRLRIQDSDRPFPFEAYVAIASYVRHHGQCQVQVDALPYGMWWQELRPDIDLVVGPINGPTDDLTGVWMADGEWIEADHEGYATAAAPYREAVTWLDEPEHPKQELPERK